MGLHPRADLHRRRARTQAGAGEEPDAADESAAKAVDEVTGSQITTFPASLADGIGTAVAPPDQSDEDEAGPAAAAGPGEDEEDEDDDEREDGFADEVGVTAPEPVTTVGSVRAATRMGRARTAPRPGPPPGRRPLERSTPGRVRRRPSSSRRLRPPAGRRRRRRQSGLGRVRPRRPGRPRQPVARPVNQDFPG